MSYVKNGLGTDILDSVFAKRVASQGPPAPPATTQKEQEERGVWGDIYEGFKSVIDWRTESERTAQAESLALMNQGGGVSASMPGWVLPVAGVAIVGLVLVLNKKK